MATETETITNTSLKPTESFPFPHLPPFPDDIPTAPLLRLSLSKLRTDPVESDRLFSASKDLGFFYLDLRGDEEGETLLEEADKFFELGPKLYDIGRDELQKYDYKSQGSYMGYKGLGAAVVDEKGNLDRNEFYNVCIYFHLLLPVYGQDGGAETNLGSKRRLPRHLRITLRAPATPLRQLTTHQVLYPPRPRSRAPRPRPPKHPPAPPTPHSLLATPQNRCLRGPHPHCEIATAAALRPAHRPRQTH
jgi:hypothetical protein